MFTKFKNKHLFHPIVIVLVTILIYFSSINNDFIENWDDNQYILNNPQVVNNEFGIPVTEIFSEYSMGHYHPFTILSYAIEYKLFDLDSGMFHFTNLFLHILNSLLVFCFFLLLFKNRWFSFLAALIFSLHPMHVESVAWISSRKDLLYSAFFLISMIIYLKYIQTGKFRFLVFTFITFIFSVLSKSAAIVLPMVLLLLDIYNKKLSVKTVLEKIPFLAISVIMGIISINAQEAPIINAPVFSIFDRTFLVSYSIGFYLVKFFIPFNLSAIHYYPDKTDGALPPIFYISILIIIALIIIYFLLKKHRQILLLSLGFFLINMSLVIQLFPMGEAFIAERYTYMPYLGLIFLLFPFFEKNKKSNTWISIIIIAVLLVFSVQTRFRIEKWKNGITLFSDIINKYPDKGFAYFNRGLLYLKMRDYQNAEKDLDDAIKLNINHAKAYFSRGNAKFFFGNYKDAIEDNTKAIELDSTYISAYYNRGLAYAYQGNYKEAIKDFSSVLEMDSLVYNAYSDRANAYYGLKDYEIAIKDFNYYLNKFSTSSKDLYMRGLCYYNLELYDKACVDWKLAASLNFDLAKKAVEANCLN